jgi:hypothetical protein
MFWIDDYVLIDAKNELATKSLPLHLSGVKIGRTLGVGENTTAIKKRRKSPDTNQHRRAASLTERCEMGSRGSLTRNKLTDVLDA